MNASDLWTLALAELEQQMARATFDTWLRTSRALELAEGRLVVEVSNLFGLEWLHSRLQPLVQRTIDRLTEGTVEVSFVGRPAAAMAPRQRPGGEVPGGEEEGSAVGSDLPESADQPARDTLRASGDAASEGDAAGEGEAAARGAPAVQLEWVDFYIKLKLAFRKRGLRELKGPRLSVFLCLALHANQDGVAAPGIRAIMRETGYSRGPVCRSLVELESLGLVDRMLPLQGPRDRYRVLAYAWFGPKPTPSLWEEA